MSAPAQTAVAVATKEELVEQRQGMVTLPTLLADRYEVERLLGEGAFGRTYLAKDRETSQMVAVKELQPGRLKSWKDLELFERESQVLRTLAHPGIPNYLDHFVVENDGVPSSYCLVQEFIEGKTLEELVADKTVFGEDEVRDIAAQLLDILQYLHSLTPPVIHRDIKPANLIMRPDGRLALIDFGTVREVLDASDQQDGSTLVGTFGYMPPEQYAGQAYQQTDLFAVGATCAHLLTGQSPERLFGELFQIVLPDDVGVTLGFRQWLDRLMEPDIARRYETASAAKSDLDEAFLMQTDGRSRSGHKLAPYPGHPPRRYPGFHFKDPSRGSSHLFASWLAMMAAVITLALPAASFVLGQPAWSVLGFPIFVGAAAVAWWRTRRAQRAIRHFQHAEYTIGEVVRAYLSPDNLASKQLYLEFRYYVGGRYYRGHVTTAHKVLKTLGTGDPIGVLYDPERPAECQVYVG